MTTAQVWRLYRFYDADGQLLYLGITGRIPLKRLIEHLKTKAWVAEVARWEVDRQTWATEVEALVAERNAIRREKPKHNVTHNKPSAAALAELREWDIRAAKQRAKSHEFRGTVLTGVGMFVIIAMIAFGHGIVAQTLTVLAATVAYAGTGQIIFSEVLHRRARVAQAT